MLQNMASRCYYTNFILNEHFLALHSPHSSSACPCLESIKLIEQLQTSGSGSYNLHNNEHGDFHTPVLSSSLVEVGSSLFSARPAVMRAYISDKKQRKDSRDRLMDTYKSRLRAKQ